MPIDPSDERFLSRVIEASIRIALIAALVGWCFTIMRPFIGPVAWAIIIAVAVHPFFIKLRGRLGGHAGSAAALLVLLGLTLLILPTWMLGGTAIDGAQALAEGLQEGKIKIPPVPEFVSGIPFVGDRIAEAWGKAYENLAAVIVHFEPQLIAFGGWLLGSVARGGVVLAVFVLSIVIAGVLLANDAAGQRAALSIGQRLAERGEEFVTLAGNTVQSVAQGILGVALIQSFLTGLGFLVAGLPGAGLWAMIALLLCVIQVGPMLLMIPAIIWGWSELGTVGAVLFTIWCVVVGFIDNVLKPILLGRGVKVPTVVIFLGAIGGFLSSGIIGLFVGSVVLVLGYTLFMAWLEAGDGAAEAGSAGA